MKSSVVYAAILFMHVCKIGLLHFISEFFGGEVLIFTKFFRGKPIFCRGMTQFFRGKPIFYGSLQG